MKLLEHPNIVNLVEVIDDPNIDKFYMGMQSCSLFYIFLFYYNMTFLNFPLSLSVLEYVEGKMVCDNGIEEAIARNYIRDIIFGLLYLHSHVR
jgi:calcium/calmodulin-dependent protein kinase kinase 1